MSAQREIHLFGGNSPTKPKTRISSIDFYSQEISKDINALPFLNPSKIMLYNAQIQIQKSLLKAGFLSIIYQDCADGAKSQEFQNRPKQTDCRNLLQSDS